MTKRISIAVLSGYLIGAVTGAVWIGSSEAIFRALLLAPVGICMAANEFIWGQIAITLSLVATGLFVALFIASRLTDRPILIVIGSFVLTATLAFFGGSTGAAISSV